MVSSLHPKMMELEFLVAKLQLKEKRERQQKMAIVIFISE
jgi:hypothetical protein